MKLTLQIAQPMSNAALLQELIAVTGVAFDLELYKQPQMDAAVSPRQKKSWDLNPFLKLRSRPLPSSSITLIHNKERVPHWLFTYALDFDVSELMEVGACLKWLVTFIPDEAYFGTMTHPEFESLFVLQKINGSLQVKARGSVQPSDFDTWLFCFVALLGASN